MKPHPLGSLRVTIPALAVASLAAVGCITDPIGGDPSTESREVSPGDFVAASSGRSESDAAATVAEGNVAEGKNDPALTRDVVMVQPGGTDTAPSNDSARPQVRVELAEDTPGGSVSTDANLSDEPPAQSTRTAGPLPIDGMIGQINGQPVYADDILADLEPALRALGQRESTGAFRAQAREEIDQAVRSMLVNALILGEAERALTEHQWNGVRFMQNQKRQELLRQHGQGSIAVAERNLFELTGRTLRETLDRYRDGLITDSYVRQNLSSRVNVSRRDIERYYRDHNDQFNTPTQRDLTLVVVDGQESADVVLSELNHGVAFKDIAAGPLNQLEGGGVLTGITGDAPFGRPAVEEAMAELSPQDWAGPIDVGDGRFWFVWVDAKEDGRNMSLIDAQAVIERSLQEAQFNLLTNEFKERLLREGSYESPERMIDALVDIAASRYAVR